MLDKIDLKSNLEEIWQRVESAGGSKETVTLIGVTKTFPSLSVANAMDIGLEDFGENYSQELISKHLDTCENQNPRWHFIGGLQSKKISKLSEIVSVWHSIDRISLAQKLGRKCLNAEVFIQVNTTEETQKSGCRVEDVAKLVEKAREADLNVLGLMTMGDQNYDPRYCFELLAQLAQDNELSSLSMGMSNDFELAVELGSTHIRIGSALFGQRS